MCNLVCTLKRLGYSNCVPAETSECIKIISFASNLNITQCQKYTWQPLWIIFLHAFVTQMLIKLVLFQTINCDSCKN